LHKEDLPGLVRQDFSSSHGFGVSFQLEGESKMLGEMVQQRYYILQTHRHQFGHYRCCQPFQDHSRKFWLRIEFEQDPSEFVIISALNVCEKKNCNNNISKTYDG
jgi:hypothetical protein